jgi:drug/metabolite transporter (DMT)-like permease
MSWLSLALIAALLKSFSSLSEKQVLTKEDALVYTTAFSFVIAFISLPLLWFIKDTSISSSTLGVIYFCSLMSVFSSITAAMCIKKLDISESASLFALSPLIVTFLSILFLHEPINSVQLIGIFISVFGVFVLEYHTHRPENQGEIKSSNVSAYIILFISLIFFSVGTALDRYIIHDRGVSPLYYLLVIQFFVLLNICIYNLICNRRNIGRKVINPKLFLRISFWANMVFIVAHRIVHMFAVQMIGAGVLNAVKQLNTFFTTLIGGKFFLEKHILQRLVGCSCIIAGIILVIIWSI